MSADRLIKLLSTAFRKDPDSNNYKIIAIIATGFDELEKVLEDIRNAHFVETAQGKSLDYIAKLFNVTRQQGESDEDLRARLFVEFKKYLSCGTKDDILQVIKFYAKLRDEDYRNIPFIPDNLFILEPEPANFVVVVPVLNTYDEELRCKLYSEEFRAWFKEKLRYIVNQVKVGGVKGDVIILYPKSSGFDNQGLTESKAQALIGKTENYDCMGFAESKERAWGDSVKSETYDSMGFSMAQGDAIDWMPSVESYDNQGFVGVLAFVLVGETSCYDSMGLASSEAQALAGKSNSYDNQGVNSSKAKVIKISDNDRVSSVNEDDWVEKKVLSYTGCARFTKCSYDLQQNTNGSGKLKIEYRINNGEWNLIGVTSTDHGTYALDITTCEGDTIEFKLSMKNPDAEPVYNDVFEVEGVYP